ncbi:hypothetical protein BDW69DRAFT_162742 [Aspergillus filifer]
MAVVIIIRRSPLHTGAAIAYAYGDSLRPRSYAECMEAFKSTTPGDQPPPYLVGHRMIKPSAEFIYWVLGQLLTALTGRLLRPALILAAFPGLFHSELDIYS